MTRLCVAVVVVAPSSSSLRRRRFVAHPPAHSRLGHPFLGAPSSPLSSLPPSRRRSVVVAASSRRRAVSSPHRRRSRVAASLSSPLSSPRVLSPFSSPSSSPFPLDMFIRPQAPKVQGLEAEAGGGWRETGGVETETGGCNLWRQEAAFRRQYLGGNISVATFRWQRYSAEPQAPSVWKRTRDFSW